MFWLPSKRCRVLVAFKLTTDSRQPASVFRSVTAISPVLWWIFRGFRPLFIHRFDFLSLCARTYEENPCRARAEAVHYSGARRGHKVFSRPPVSTCVSSLIPSRVCPGFSVSRGSSAAPHPSIVHRARSGLEEQVAEHQQAINQFVRGSSQQETIEKKCPSIVPFRPTRPPRSMYWPCPEISSRSHDWVSTEGTRFDPVKVRFFLRGDLVPKKWCKICVAWKCHVITFGGKIFDFELVVQKVL